MRPLKDVRVLDLSRLLPGPFATLVLADLGATVDKLEDAQGGDYLRHMPPEVAGESAAFHLLNRGKRSAIVDLKKPEGRAALQRLVASYDVLFDQFRPGVMDCLGLGHAALRTSNPKLIVCALTGYGQTGPLALRAGHDIDYLARAGVLGAQGPADGPPAVPGFQMADVSGGLWSVVAILAALAEREKTGLGCVLDISMTDGVIPFASTTLAGALAGLPVKRGDEILSGGIAPYNTYLAKDGAPMALGALEPKFWMGFCAAVGLEPSLDALFTGPHQVELKRKVAEVIASRTRAEWVEFGNTHDVCLEPVVLQTEVATDPLFVARDLFFKLPTPRGDVPQLRLPITPRDVDFTPPPRAGEHSRDVLRDAGFSNDEIDALIAAGAVKSS